jgi:hypothetical protein
VPHDVSDSHTRDRARQGAARRASPWRPCLTGRAQANGCPSCANDQAVPADS